MKKRSLSLLLLLSMILTLAGCNNNIYHWEFEYGYEEITQIKIIDILDTDVEAGHMNYIEIQEIDLSLAEQIYSDVIDLEMKKNNRIRTAYPEGKCFFIVFESGEYDIIAGDVSVHYKYEGGKIKAHSMVYFATDDFESLIEKYLNVTKGDW